MNGFAPATTGHGCCFAGGDDDDELSDAEGLDVDDIGGPGVGRVCFADVEEHGFGVLACFLLLAGRCDGRADDVPEGVRWRAGVVLHKVEGTGAVGGARCEGVAHCSGAGGGKGAVAEVDGVIGEVNKGVEGADVAGDGCEAWGGEDIEGAVCLTLSDFKAGLCTAVVQTEVGSSAVAVLALSIGASGIIESALLVRAIFTVGAENIG